MKKQSIFSFVAGGVLVLVIWLIGSGQVNWLNTMWKFLWGQKMGIAIGVISTILVVRVVSAIKGIAKKEPATPSSEEPRRRPRR